jgi:hypothetical protein
MPVDGIDQYSTFTPPQAPPPQEAPAPAKETEVVTEENVGKNVNTSA